MNKEKTGFALGIVLVLVFVVIAYLVAGIDFIKNNLRLSALIIGILIGMLWANTFGGKTPSTWAPGIKFCSKRILRFGIILYGFNVTLNDVAVVGLPAIGVDAIIVTFTILLGMLVGKWLKMDSEITLLTSVGSSICGAAAVLGAESAMRVQPYKTAVAVSTVVIFGTIAMFLYPIMYSSGITGLTEQQMAVYTGGTVHEVAHVVGAGGAIGGVVETDAIIVKMIRVMMLVPVLLVISFAYSKKNATSDGATGKGKINIPWFAIFFLVMIVINSMNWIPQDIVGYIKQFDTFLLTMAMTALGVETSFDKFKKAGAKPFVLALILFCWLIVGGYLICKFLLPLMMP